jgi:hypothetical protein
MAAKFQLAIDCADREPEGGAALPAAPPSAQVVSPGRCSMQRSLIREQITIIGRKIARSCEVQSSLRTKMNTIAVSGPPGGRIEP